MPSSEEGRSFDNQDMRGAPGDGKRRVDPPEPAEQTVEDPQGGPEDDAAHRHVPVMLEEIVDLVQPGCGQRVLDCTLGMGGHSESFLAAGSEIVGVDRDPEARSLAQHRLSAYADRLTILPMSFGTAAQRLVADGERFDAVLADLGVSSWQLDAEHRGFGIRSAAEADMRMGDESGETAIDLIDRLDADELANVIYRYGEERRSRRIARALKEAVAAGTTRADGLADVIRRCVPGHHRRHPALRTFQALRIAVNDELGQLETLLSHTADLLAPNGVMIVLTFHSLEDRLVKHTWRDQVRAGVLAAASKKVVTASQRELQHNRRAASAKLRWARAHAARESAHGEQEDQS